MLRWSEFITVIARLRRALRPTQNEIEALAVQEAGGADYLRFEPICRGPVAAAALLAWVGLCAPVVVLWRFVRGGEK